MPTRRLDFFAIAVRFQSVIGLILVAIGGVIFSPRRHGSILFLAPDNIANIVRQGIVVCISSNDGTRLYTLTAIGPDGGSAPTDRLKPGERPTSRTESRGPCMKANLP